MIQKSLKFDLKIDPNLNRHIFSFQKEKGMTIPVFGIGTVILLISKYSKGWWGHASAFRIKYAVLGTVFKGFLYGKMETR